MVNSNEQVWGGLRERGRTLIARAMSIGLHRELDFFSPSAAQVDIKVPVAQRAFSERLGSLSNA